ncbi:hypothetical protein EYC59_01565 [Candidatus Saccharibacteria bacterium]|nr:MAG: hypothetical protein EYC59_01565 [Candidatus Saccharibacteria bacterium]
MLSRAYGLAEVKHSLGYSLGSAELLLSGTLSVENQAVILARSFLQEAALHPDQVHRDYAVGMAAMVRTALENITDRAGAETNAGLRLSIPHAWPQPRPEALFQPEATPVQLIIPSASFEQPIFGEAA